MTEPFVDWDEGDMVYVDFTGRWDPLHGPEVPPVGVLYFSRDEALALWRALDAFWRPSWQDWSFIPADELPWAPASIPGPSRALPEGVENSPIGGERG